MSGESQRMLLLDRLTSDCPCLNADRMCMRRSNIRAKCKFAGITKKSNAECLLLWSFIKCVALEEEWGEAITILENFWSYTERRRQWEEREEKARCKTNVGPPPWGFLPSFLPHLHFQKIFWLHSSLISKGNHYFLHASTPLTFLSELRLFSEETVGSSLSQPVFL